MRILTLTIALLVPTACSAAPASCKSIPDDTKRLACYDAQAGASEAPAWAAAKAAMARRLSDPESARWGSYFLTPAGEVCGTVNAKNKLGGYAGATGFVYVPKDGMAYATGTRSRLMPFGSCVQAAS